MPYIPREQRERISKHLIDLCGSVGSLNYSITFLCHEYVKEFGLNYDTLNEVVGVLECAKQEFYRQVVAKYEDKKKRENGAISILDEKSLEDVR